MSNFLKQLGFEQKGNYYSNPTSGTKVYTNRDGQRMFSADFLQSPQAFNGNFASQAGLKPPQQSTPSLNTATSSTASTPAPSAGATQPDYYTSQMQTEAQQMADERRQREEADRRYSQQRDDDYQRGLQTQLDTLGSRLGATRSTTCRRSMPQWAS